MIRKTRGASVATVVTMAIMLTLSLSVITNPLLSAITANAESPGVDTSTVSESNTTATQDPLGDAVLTLDDGTNVLNSEPNSGPSPDPSNDAANSDLPADSSSTSSDLGGDATTGEVEPTGGPATGEVGDSTGEVGTSTGEVLPSGDAPGVEIVPSEGTPSTTGGETAANVSSTDEGATPDDNSAGTSGQSVTPSPSTELDITSGGPEIRNGNTQPSSSSSSVDSNGNALTAESASAASAENPNAVVQKINAGDGQTVSLGDVSNNAGSSAKLSLDKKQYKPGDSAVLTISDPAANIDPDSVNTIAVIIDGVPLTATEDEKNSGNFNVDFVVKAGGSKLAYDSTRPQAQVVMNGVSTDGSVQVRELPLAELQPYVVDFIPPDLIGNAFEVTLIGGAELDTTDGFCESNNLVPPSTTSSSRCGGSSTVTISYANVPQDLHGQFADTLTIWQYVPVVINGVTEFGWVDLSQYGGQPAYNFETKTVTAISPFGPGIFVLAFPGDGSGGGGGAMGFAGAGIVLDLVAPVVSETPISESTTSLPDTTTLNADDDDTSVNVSATVSATQEPVKSGVGQGEESDVVAISRNGNTTIAVPGAGNVTLSFTNLISEGELTVSAAKDSDLGGFKVVKNGGDPAKLMSLDNVPYSLAGNVFVIGPPDSEFKGTMTVSVPFKQALVPSGSEVRLLHYTGSGWEDVTTQSTHLDLVSGSLNSLGAVAPAVKSQAINLVSAVQ